MPKLQILTGILYNQEVLKHVIIACVSNGPRGYMYIIHAAVSLALQMKTGLQTTDFLFNKV